MLEQVDAESAWTGCDRGDWMLWIATRLQIPAPLVVLAACDCAKLALPLATTGKLRLLQAIAAAQAWAAVAPAFAPDAAVCDAAYAARIVSGVAQAASTVAAVVARDGGGRREVLRNCADLVRDRIGWHAIQPALERAADDRCRAAAVTACANILNQLVGVETIIRAPGDRG